MKFNTVLLLATALCLPLELAGCNDEGVGGLVSGTKHLRPLKPDMIKLMETKEMRKEDPILIRVFKEDNTLEVWKRNRTGQFAMLKSYQLCTWGGTLGPKLKQGDKQSPEGFYTVTPGRMNPNSQFFLSFDVGFPNAFDRAYGRTGGDVMVHGSCVNSAGCFIVTDAQVEEIYGLAREAFAGGQQSFQVQAFPFRMTAQNMAKHRRNPNMAFWRNIKEGYDHFELTKLEPKVDVCEKRYVFGAHPTSSDSSIFNPAGACPSYQVPEQLASLVKAKQSADDAEFKTIVAELDAKDKAAIDAELAAKMDAAKPKQPSVIASILGMKPAEPQATATTTVGTPVNVPIPKASPRSPVATTVASADTGTTQSAKTDNGVLGVNIGSLFSFGQAPETTAPTVVAPTPPPVVRPVAAIAKPGTPMPAVKPQTSAPLQASVAPQPVKPASSSEPAWWQKINPFGG